MLSELDLLLALSHSICLFKSLDRVRAYIIIRVFFFSLSAEQYMLSCYLM